MPNMLSKIKDKLLHLVPPASKKETQHLFWVLEIAYRVHLGILPEHLAGNMEGWQFWVGPEQEGDLRWIQTVVQAALMLGHVVWQVQWC